MKDYLTRDEEQEFFRLFRKKAFRLKDTGTTSRVFNLWKRKGMMPCEEGFKYTGRTKLSFAEYIWIKIIQDLRHFGCPLEYILIAKQSLFNHSWTDLEADIHRHGINKLLKNYFDKLENKGGFKNRAEWERKMERVEQAIKEKKVYDIVSGLHERLNNLENMIVGIVKENKDAYLMFDRGGFIENIQKKKLVKKRGRPEKQHPSFSFTFTEDTSPRESPEYPHIKIPLRHYIKGFIADRTKEKQVEEIKILSDEQLKLLRSLRAGDVTEIRMKMKDGKAGRIEVTEELKTDAEKRLIETYTNHEYATITYQIQDGKMVNIKKTTKVK